MVDTSPPPPPPLIPPLVFEFASFFLLTPTLDGKLRMSDFLPSNECKRQASWLYSTILDSPPASRTNSTIRSRSLRDARRAGPVWSKRVQRRVGQARWREQVWEKLTEDHNLEAKGQCEAGAEDGDSARARTRDAGVRRRFAFLLRRKTLTKRFFQSDEELR